MCVSFWQPGSWIPTLRAFQLACCLLFETEGQWPSGCEWWEWRLLPQGQRGSAGVTSTPIHACGLFYMVTDPSVGSIKCYMIETRLVWLKRWKTFTVSMDGKEKTWGTEMGVVIQKCRDRVKASEFCNLSEFNYKILLNRMFMFSLFCIKINGKSLSTFKSHYLPQENEMVIVCLFIVFSNCSCMC